ncbi:MAG: hypothetical protein EPN38_06000 [Rhodanobacteraceae bacterium]|nr:MAG: hypothetical protein EPN38_06000 [Rhodanobacteraceae bacterium]
MHYLTLIAPPFIGVAVVAVLVFMLHLLLRVPAAGSADSAIRELVATAIDADGACDQTERWSRITAHWPPWITRIVPIVVGLLILAVGLWVFAYPGWLFLTQPGEPAPPPVNVAPPWFGTPGWLAWCGVIGAVMTFAAVMSATVCTAALLGIAWLVGRFAIWPEAFIRHRQ